MRGTLAGLLLVAAAAAGASGEANDPATRANRLAREKSPYLLQHARNPVDWRPWGEQAFREARRARKPIFLSIGYSTCHWCHVMERESFSDPKTAALLNRGFVPVKVDREERPDVDKVYMTAVQAMTGQGGWPLSVWLTPDLKPFYGGTYFPPEPRWGSPGFRDLLERLSELWEKDPGKLSASSEQLAGLVAGALAQGATAAAPADAGTLDAAFRAYAASYDPEHAGFGGAPKFPMPAGLALLLRHHARNGSKKALDMAAATLRAMARGGIYDQLGGGFARYSTDEAWRVPHFEKMLYDNAQLLAVYAEAYQLTGEEDFARVARETADYVLRDMAHPEGGFYSAEDADSLPPPRPGQPAAEHKAEGAFYAWEKWEVLKVLGKEDGELFCRAYGVEPGGNVRRDPHGEFREKSVLYAAEDAASLARGTGQTPGEVQAALRRSREKLFEARTARPRPHLDDKILASWNGLMISGLARAAQALDEPRYARAAEKAARFVLDRLYDPGAKRLFRRWREGERKVPGTADDYAFLAQGLLDLYETDFRLEWLERALALTEEQQRLFFDQERGGYFLTAAGDDPSLPVRAREDADGVEPAAASVAVSNLLRLAQFAGRDALRVDAERTLRAFSGALKERPLSMARMLASLDYWLAGHQQIVVAGDPEAPDTLEMLRLIRSRFLPDKILALAPGGKGQEALTRFMPFARNMRPVEGKATAYVCVNFACELPTSDLKTLGELLGPKRPG